jgi:uncharacterized SAM-binding protein YcdF (DUF218 family)
MVRLRVAALVTLVITTVLAMSMVISTLYVNPAVAEPLTRADAVIVLGGTPYTRFEYGIELAERGLAPEVVISNSVGADDVRMQTICATPTSVEVTCFLPEPWTTRGEAREIRTLAEQRGWKTIIVVTTKAHISRARYILGRCFGGDIMMTDYPEQLSVFDNVTGWVYQTAGWVRALTQRGC